MSEGRTPNWTPPPGGPPFPAPPADWDDEKQYHVYILRCLAWAAIEQHRAGLLAWSDEEVDLNSRGAAAESPEAPR